MKYTDRIYGEFEISEPIIIELINSFSLQRLKGVDQIGYFEPYFPGTAHSRFEHSLGVCILLNKYSAPIEEQIAGLIHDVSHTAFSHCIDYALAVGSEKKHNHQDNVFSDFVKKSEIPNILKKYNFDLDYILDESNFPLKEKELPDLCADRIDYSLRTAMIFRELNQTDIKYFLAHLIVKEKKWVFKDFESAKKYAELFFKLNKNYYAGLPSAVMFRTVGDYLQYAIKQDYISEDGLFATDKIVMSKINTHLDKDEKLRLFYDRMNNKIRFCNDSQNYDTQVFCKSRIVDPLCEYNKEIKRVSEIAPQWLEIVKQESKPKEYFIKFDKK